MPDQEKTPLNSQKPKETSLPSKTKNEEDILFMNPVDAALYRQPKVTTTVLSIGTVLAGITILLWAALAKVDEVTKAQGQVISSQGTQIIQNLEGGILKEVLVKEGSVVEKNAILARISNEVSTSEYQAALEKSYALRAEIMRLEAEINESTPSFDEDLQKNAPQICADQLRIFEANKKQLESELTVLNSEYQLKSQNAKAQASKQSSMENTLKLSQDQLKIAENLSAQHLYSTVDLLNQKQEVIKLEEELNNLKESLPSLFLEADLAQQKYDLRKAEVHLKQAENLTKNRAELKTLQQSISLGTDRLSRTELRSPVRGTVKRVMVNTIGAVIQPGMPVMEIVPLDDTLLIEAKIRPADIAFIQPNQNAIVKVTAYDFSIYGGLEGIVETISGDTIEDKKGDVYYLANIRTQQNYLFHKGEKLPIIPGMITTVDILTGKKTVLDFLLKPILKTKQEAFTER